MNGPCWVIEGGFLSVGYFRQDTEVLDGIIFFPSEKQNQTKQKMLQKREFWGIQVKLFSGKWCGENRAFEVSAWIAARANIPNETVSWPADLKFLSLLAFPSHEYLLLLKKETEIWLNMFKWKVIL